MREPPTSLYHLQLSEEFNLKKAKDLIPYLYDLGVDGLYCSPIFESFSTGYDITNPNRLNPKLGKEEDLDAFCSALKERGMKLVLDIVPNHMGIKGDRNLWWMSVLEEGPSSPYADFFDINWNSESPVIRGKILLPILNGFYGKVLESGEIQLIWNQGFWIRYFDYLLPLSYPSYEFIFPVHPRMKEDFLQIAQSNQNRIEDAIFRINQNKELLHELLEKQFYRLAYCAVAGQEINYRRFFNINELVAIHIEKEKVFQEHHRWIFELLDSDKVQGLRVDHPDGLYDPSQYFERIQKRKLTLVWAEKILDYEEALPEKWNIAGTVGYEFLNLLSGVFIQKKNEQKITAIYERFIEKEMEFENIHYSRRKAYIHSHMAGEINRLGSLLDTIAEKNRNDRDFTRADLTKACLEIIACFPVYRTYIQPGRPIHPKEKGYIEQAVEAAKKKAEEIDPSLFDFIQGLLLLEKEDAANFLLRFQQITAPVMAKGLEDSTFYLYNRLISLNEVGNHPHNFGFSKEEFHAFNQKKLALWPLGLLPSSTHDSKYSEDARLSLHAISEIPHLWEKEVMAWKKKHRKYKTKIGGRLFPDLNTEYLIYQMIVALGPDEKKRLWTCIQKAVREAGVFTSWQRVDPKYEKAVEKFLRAILKKKRSFQKIHTQICKIGSWSSLSSVVLKMGSCGIVDLYQGNEKIHYALLNPDNRRPIDFEKEKDLKLFITSKSLHFRKEHKTLMQGTYIPLKTPDSVIAFLRKKRREEAIFIARRFFTEKKMSRGFIPGKFRSKKFLHIFSGKTVFVHKKGLPLKALFADYPFGILIAC